MIEQLLWITACVMFVAALILVFAAIIGRRLGDRFRLREAESEAMRIAVLIQAINGDACLPRPPKSQERSRWHISATDLAAVIEGPERERLKQLTDRWIGENATSGRAPI